MKFTAQLFSSADESLKNETHLLLLWAGLLKTLYTFVFTHVMSAGKPVHIFMARSRFSKSHLKAELCFHCVFSFNFNIKFFRLIYFIFHFELHSFSSFLDKVLQLILVFDFGMVLKLVKLQLFFIPWSSIGFICFSKAFPKGKYKDFF